MAVVSETEVDCIGALIFTKTTSLSWLFDDWSISFRVEFNESVRFDFSTISDDTWNRLFKTVRLVILHSDDNICVLPFD